MKNLPLLNLKFTNGTSKYFIKLLYTVTLTRVDRGHHFSFFGTKILTTFYTLKEWTTVVGPA